MTRSYHKYTEKETKFIIDNLPKYYVPELVKKFNKKFNANITAANIRQFKCRNKLHSGLVKNPRTGFRKLRHKPRKEYFESVRKAVGYECVNCQGKVMIKISNNLYSYNYMPKARYVYEQKHGKIPNNYVLIHKDGNATNCDINNLKLVSKSERSFLSKNGLVSTNEQLMDAALTLQQLNKKIKQLKVDKIV